MPKGVTDTFADGVARLLSEVGRLRAYADADDDLLNGIQDMLVGKVRGLSAGPGPTPQDMAMQSLAGAVQGMPGGAMPVTEAGLSRGPTPGLDMRDATNALERELAGQV